MISISKSRIALAILFLLLFGDQGCTGITSTAGPSLPTATLSSSSTSATQLDLSQMSVEEWASTSRDGIWIATGLVAFPKENTGGRLAYVRLMILSADGKTFWKIIDEWEEPGLGFPKPVSLKWSQDGKHFYFSHRVVPDGCSVFDDLSDLQRVNLEDGSVDELLPHSALRLTLAPDESEVAFIGYGNRGLVLKDLVSGEEQETKIDPGKSFEAGNILWSPDGKSLVLTLAINPCTRSLDSSKTISAEATTILQVDAKTLQQKVLVNEDPRLFVTTEWNEPDKIITIDGKENSLWYLDVNTGEISKK